MTDFDLKHKTLGTIFQYNVEAHERNEKMVTAMTSVELIDKLKIDKDTGYRIITVLRNEKEIECHEIINGVAITLTDLGAGSFCDSKYIKLKDVIEKERLELDNIRRANKKIKNEWWKNPLTTFVAFILGISATLITQYIQLRVLPKEPSKNNNTNTVESSVSLNQKDTAKKQ